MQALSPLADFPVVCQRCQWLRLALRLRFDGCSWAYFCLVFFFLHFRFDEIAKKNNVEYHAGGSTQNSVKIAQVGLVLPRLGIHRYACNSRFVRLAALGIESVAAQHVDTLQF